MRMKPEDTEDQKRERMRLISKESDDADYHRVRHNTALSLQIALTGLSAAASAIAAFGNSDAAEGNAHLSVNVLFGACISSAVLTMLLPWITSYTSKQRSRYDFHRLLRGKLERRSVTSQEAKQMIEEYFGKWRD